MGSLADGSCEIAGESGGESGGEEGDKFDGSKVRSRLLFRTDDQDDDDDACDDESGGGGGVWAVGLEGEEPELAANSALIREATTGGGTNGDNGSRRQQSGGQLHLRVDQRSLDQRSLDRASSILTIPPPVKKHNHQKNIVASLSFFVNACKK